MDNHQYCPSTKRNHCLICGQAQDAAIHEPPSDTDIDDDSYSYSYVTNLISSMQ